jgi:hypothetical protein
VRELGKPTDRGITQRVVRPIEARDLEQSVAIAAVDAKGRIAVPHTFEGTNGISLLAAQKTAAFDGNPCMRSAS